eukprot:2805657-Rhodomonas_salina.1
MMPACAICCVIPAKSAGKREGESGRACRGDSAWGPMGIFNRKRDVFIGKGASALPAAGFRRPSR